MSMGTGRNKVMSDRRGVSVVGCVCLLGCQQYNSYYGYSYQFKWAADFDDPTPRLANRPTGVLQSYFSSEINFSCSFYIILR